MQLIVCHHIQLRADLHQPTGRAQVRLPARVQLRIHMQITEMFKREPILGHGMILAQFIKAFL